MISSQSDLLLSGELPAIARLAAVALAAAPRSADGEHDAEGVPLASVPEPETLRPPGALGPAGTRCRIIAQGARAWAAELRELAAALDGPGAAVPHERAPR